MGRRLFLPRVVPSSSKFTRYDLELSSSNVTNSFNRLSLIIRQCYIYVCLELFPLHVISFCLVKCIELSPFHIIKIQPIGFRIISSSCYQFIQPVLSNKKNQVIVYLNRNGNSATFSSYVCNTKNI